MIFESEPILQKLKAVNEQLGENETYKRLNALELRLQKQESFNFKLKTSIATKNTESDYSMLANRTRATLVALNFELVRLKAIR